MNNPLQLHKKTTQLKTGNLNRYFTNEDIHMDNKHVKRC